MPDSKN